MMGDGGATQRETIKDQRCTSWRLECDYRMTKDHLSTQVDFSLALSFG